MTADDKTLQVAARLVCTDQWLRTHVDPSWTILSVKQYLLHKFLRADPESNPRAIPVSPRKARRRSLSPITFAAPPPRKALVTTQTDSDESSLSDVSGDVDFDDEDVNITKSLADIHRYKYSIRPSTSSASESVTRLLSDDGPDPQGYTLLTFSTTQILEDRFTLEWYGVQPDELLELHPVSVSFVSLPRYTLDAYIAPYFAARVWALRISGHKLDCAPGVKGRPGDEEGAPDAKSTREKGKRRVAVEWKERWAIIHQGVFSLCKERHDTHAAFSVPLSMVLSIRDNAHFAVPKHARRPRHKSSAPPSSNVVCLKFGTSTSPRQRTFSGDSLSVTFERRSSEPHTASSSGGQGAWWRRGSRDVSSALSLGITSSASVLVGSGNGTGIAEVWDSLARKGSRAGLDEYYEGEPGSAREKGKGKEQDMGADAVWIVLDMLDSSACSHILRILHRHASPACQSTFLPERTASMYSPAPSPIIFSTRASTPNTPTTPGPSSSYTFPPPLSSAPSLVPTQLSSTAPSSTSISFSFPGSGPSTPGATPGALLPTIDTSVSTSAPCPGVDYPSWRLMLVRKARRAGLGAVGRAMELVMFGDEGEDDLADVEDIDDDDELAIEWARRNSSVDPSPIDPPVSSVTIQRQRSRTYLQLPPRHASDPAVLSLADLAEYDLTTPEPQTPVPSADPCPRLPRKASHPHVDLRSLSTDVDMHPDSDGSEVEWDGWVDAVVARRRERALAARSRARQAALADSAVTEPSPFWGTGWSTQFGGSRGSPSPATTPDRDRADDGEGDDSWVWPRGSDVDADTESSTHSSDPHAPSLKDVKSSVGSRGRRAKNLGHGGRTLSSYSSVDSLLRRTVTMRTSMKGINIKNMGFSQAKRASMHVLFPGASRSDAHLPTDVPQRAASASPPPVTSPAHLARPSLVSMRSTTSMNIRARPLSPLSSQVPEGYYDDDGGDGGVDGDGETDVDDVEEQDGDGEGYTESEFGHHSGARVHPMPLPGMRMVPSGYTTFQHSALYGMGQGEDMAHAGIAHGQSMQRLPMGMARMMTTVSSTVSVGRSARKGGGR